MEKSTGVEASIQVKPSYGLTDSEIASMIKDSMSYAEQDVKPECWQNKSRSGACAGKSARCAGC